MDITKLKQDDNLAEAGVWVDFEDARFKICSTDSRRYRRVLTTLAKKRNPNRLRKDPEAMHEMTVEGMADGILLDWEGLQENGQPLHCTRENKMKVCQIEAIRSFLATEAQDMTNFQQEALAEDADTLKSGD